MGAGAGTAVAAGIGISIAAAMGTFRPVRPSTPVAGGLPIEIFVRPAVVSDLGPVRDIYNHYVPTSTCTFQVEPDTEAERLAWFRDRSPTHPVVVADAAGEVVAGRPSPRGSPGAPTPGRSSFRSTSVTTASVRHRTALVLDLIAAPGGRTPHGHRWGVYRTDRQPCDARSTRVQAGGLLPRGRLQVRPVAGRGLHATPTELTAALMSRPRRARPRWSRSTPDAHALRAHRSFADRDRGSLPSPAPSAAPARPTRPRTPRPAARPGTPPSPAVLAAVKADDRRRPAGGQHVRQHPQ